MTIAEAYADDFPSFQKEVTDFLASSPSPEAIIAFRLSSSSEQFISDLLEANRTRNLTRAERRALDDYTQIERFIEILKAKVNAKLDQSSR